MNELKKCPFCGGDAKVYSNFPCTAYGVGCINEGCSANARHLNFDSENEAIEAWNTRKPSEEVVAMLEGLKSMFDENNSQLRYERFCKPKEKKCKDTNCFACVLGESIKIIKEGMG